MIVTEIKDFPPSLRGIAHKEIRTNKSSKVVTYKEIRGKIMKNYLLPGGKTGEEDQDLWLEATSPESTRLENSVSLPSARSLA